MRFWRWFVWGFLLAPPSARRATILGCIGCIPILGFLALPLMLRDMRILDDRIGRGW